jgi:hypothetical protein
MLDYMDTVDKKLQRCERAILAKPVHEFPNDAYIYSRCHPDSLGPTGSSRQKAFSALRP